MCYCQLSQSIMSSARVLITASMECRRGLPSQILDIFFWAAVNDSFWLDAVLA